MLKNPYDVLKEFMKEKFDRDRKLIEFGQAQTDSLVTWLIGFAITALTLLIANFESIQTNLGDAAKPISILLTLTICSGLLFRYCSYFTVILHKRLEDYFSGVFADVDMTPIEADDDIDSIPFDEIIRRLKSDFDVEIPYPMPLTDELKQIELPRLINHYKDWCQHSRKQFNIAVNHWAEINETAYKIKKSKTVKSFENIGKTDKIGFRLRRWAIVNALLYLSCLLSFMIAVIVICVYLVES